MAEPFAVILDRDGVICENREDHVKNWREFQLLPGVVEALASLKQAGACLFVVTNQGVVGRGIISEAELKEIHDRMAEVLDGAGAGIQNIYACIHHPADGCGCRKPGIGLLVQASDENNFDLEEAFMIGDYTSDIEAGAASGCTTVLVRTGRGKAAERIVASGETIMPDVICNDLLDAAFWIMAERGVAVTSGRRTAKERRAARKKEGGRRQ